MSAPKHTAGWQWRRADDGSPERLVDAAGASVLTVDEHCGYAWPEVSEANARLIAAAPCGLAAAEKAIAGAVVDEGPADQVNITGEAYRALIDFVAKATGADQ